MRFLSSIIVFAALLLSVVPGVHAQNSGGHVISATFQLKQIAIESPSQEVAALARLAFNAHGDYKVAAGGKTVLRLSKAGDNAVELAFRNASRQHTQTVTGRNWQDATLRACDVALKLEGQAPFFAGNLAFVSNLSGKKEIYVSDLFVTSVTPLTKYGSTTITPRWTRDGTEVLYTTYANQNFTDVYAINVKNLRRRGVIVGARGTTIGAVSNPVTGQLAFSSSCYGDMDLFLAAPNGGGAKQFVATKGVESDPAWSADGTKLAFASGAAGSPGIHVAKVPGGAPQRIRTTFSYSTEPSWNPVQPSKIAFTYQTNGKFGVAVVDTAGGAVEDIMVNEGRSIVRAGESFTTPVWCADGRHLVVTRIAGRSSRLALLDTKTRKVTMLSDERTASCEMPDYYFAK